MLIDFTNGEPTMHDMQSMLNLCDEFARGFGIVFNASKSTCIINCRRRSFLVGCVGDIRFIIGGNNIGLQIVDISKDGNNRIDINIL